MVSKCSVTITDPQRYVKINYFHCVFNAYPWFWTVDGQTEEAKLEAGVYDIDCAEADYDNHIFLFISHTV